MSLSVSVACLRFFEMRLSASVACLRFFETRLSVSVACLRFQIFRMSVSVACPQTRCRQGLSAEYSVCVCLTLELMMNEIMFGQTIKIKKRSSKHNPRVIILFLENKKG